ncbi:MAG: hypothetical protein HY040_17480 [Planctomycetes bacterium]|nr:hypothetical protein [Planctomycetota bacterium]
MKILAAGVIALLSLAVLLDANQAGEKAKYTISEVMVKAHKEGLLKTVASGKASEAQRKELAELYKALSQNTPPKGDAENWKKMTGALAKASAAAAKGDEGAAKSLAKLANCKVCHDKHRED